MAAESHMPAPVVRLRTSPRDRTIIPAARKADPGRGGLDEPDGVETDDVGASGIGLDKMQGNEGERGGG